MGSEWILYPPFAIALVLFFAAMVAVVAVSARRSQGRYETIWRLRREIERREAERDHASTD